MICGPKVAAYIRLSKEDEKEGESESVSNQRDLIKKYATQNNLGTCDFFIDDGYSGGNFERPNFKRMIEEIEQGNITTVITKDTSRLGRDFIETSHYMFRYFPEHNIRYIAILENFDTFNPNGVEDMIPFQTIINDWYLKDTSKKIKSVRHNKMKQGLYMGSTVPYGYKRSEENNCKFVIDEYSSQIVKRIFKMRLDGIRPTMIARTLTDEKISPPSIYSGKNTKKRFTSYLWNLSSVNCILTNQIYIGNLVQRKFDKVNYKSKKKVKLKPDDWIIAENCVEPIISKEDFYDVQKMIASNNKISHKGYNYLLKGLVVCGDCGATMTVRRRVNKRKLKEDKEEIYYCCSNNIRFRHGICSLHYFQEPKLNDIVINYLKDIFKKYIDKEELKRVGNSKKQNLCESTNLNKEIVKYNNKIDNIKEALKNIYIDKANDIISEDEFLELKEQLNNDRNEYIKKVNELNTIIKEKNKNSKEKSIINKKIIEFLNLEKPDKQLLIDLIDKIEIMENKQVKIHVRFNLEEDMK